jgi:hypothetical protein
MRILFSIGSLFMALVMLTLSSVSFAQVAIGVSVSFGPPELPVYEQPLCPAEGYIWTPGYWAWADEDYYWVPGTWVLAPEPGFFWTPAYWGWGGSSFVFYEGYWGPVVGFYGGINYGYGYFGRGYEGGRWDHDRFYYNRTVNNINVTEIHNTYNTTVINNNTNVTRVSYNGGHGGINARPTPQEEAAVRQKHISPVPAQVQHVEAARSNQSLRASENHGKPPVAATPRPAAFSDRGVVPAKEGGRYNPPPAATRSANNTNRPGTAVNPPARSENTDRPPTAVNPSGRSGNNSDRPPSAVHAKELPPVTRPPAPSTGNPRVDQKYQQQQDKLFTQQDKERQRLQQKQEQDHQRLAQQRADDARRQQIEQRHQQQTQQLQDRHAQQQQKLQERQQPPPPRQNQNPPSRPPKDKP